MEFFLTFRGPAVKKVKNHWPRLFVWKKSLISNADFSNLENDFLEICLLETVISNLISKNP